MGGPPTTESLAGLPTTTSAPGSQPEWPLGGLVATSYQALSVSHLNVECGCLPGHQVEFQLGTYRTRQLTLDPWADSANNCTCARGRQLHS